MTEIGEIIKTFMKELQKQSAKIELLNQRIDRLENQNATVKSQDVEIGGLETNSPVKREEHHETQKPITRNQDLNAQASQISEEIVRLQQPCAQHVDEFKAEFSKLNKENQKSKQQIIKLSNAIAQLHPFMEEMINARREFKETRKELQLLMPVVDELGDVNAKIQSMLKIMSYLTEYMVINEKSKVANNSIIAPVESEKVVVLKNNPKQSPSAASALEDDTKSSLTNSTPEIPGPPSTPLETIELASISNRPNSKRRPPPISATFNGSQVAGGEASRNSLAVLFGPNPRFGLFGSFPPKTKNEVSFTISNMIFTKE